MSKRWNLVVIIALSLCTPAPAGIFSRKPKVDPAEQVPTLIMQLKTDKDDAKRATAAEELRNYDPKTFPEMMTVLTDAVMKDSSPAVRTEAASTIAKLRPINQQAGFALEQAAANDPSMRVRLAARQALWQYNLLGYRSGKQVEQVEAKKVNGPELLPPPPASATKPHMAAKNPKTGGQETPEPPLAGGPSTSQKPLQPTAPPKLLKPPPTKPKADGDGPALSPPG